MNAHFDRVEILSVSLLDSYRTTVEEIRWVSQELGVGLGWHYLLDLSWAAHMLQLNPGQCVIDAGAGAGIMQWWLAMKGVNVLSVDRTSRANLGLHLRSWCPVEGLRPGDLQPPGLIGFLPPKLPWHWHRWPGKLRDALLGVMRGEPRSPEGRGTVTIYNQDLGNMSDVPDTSVDAVVSISALEHNEPDALHGVVKELMRVIKPGGRLIATLGAAKERDWYHEPSRGWCYTEATLRDRFDLPATCPSNYERYDELFEALGNCAELRDNLGEFYSRSGNNGMPWGIWDPKYQSVGVVKAKSLNRLEGSVC